MSFHSSKSEALLWFLVSQIFAWSPTKIFLIFVFFSNPPQCFVYSNKRPGCWWPLTLAKLNYSWTDKRQTEAAPGGGTRTSVCPVSATTPVTDTRQYILSTNYHNTNKARGQSILSAIPIKLLLSENSEMSLYLQSPYWIPWWEDVLNVFVARTANVEIDCKIKFKLSLLQTKI